jgi:hypothetical protein
MRWLRGRAPEVRRKYYYVLLAPSMMDLMKKVFSCDYG